MTIEYRMNLKFLQKPRCVGWFRTSQALWSAVKKTRLNRRCHGFRRHVDESAKCEKLQCLYENLMLNNSRKTAVLSQSHAWARIHRSAVWIHHIAQKSFKNEHGTASNRTSIRGSDHTQESGCDPSLDKITICYAPMKASWKHDLSFDVRTIKARFLHHQWNLESSCVVDFIPYNNSLCNLLYLSHSHSHSRSHSHSHFYSHSHDN